MSFLSETAVEIRSRIAIDPDTGTVRQGALWCEEHLPSEAVLWGIFALSGSNNEHDSRSEKDLVRALPSPDTLLQLGGKAGGGHGLMRLLIDEEAT